MIRRLALIVPLLALAAFVLLATFRPAQPLDPMVGRSVPPFDLPGLDSLHPGLSDADLRHGGVTVVNLFASWCPPCRVEEPQLKALRDRGIVVHGIAVSDQAADTQTFLKAAGDPFARVGVDKDGRVSRLLQADGLPETFVVDGTGKIAAHHIGELRPENIPALLAAIDKARAP